MFVLSNTSVISDTLAEVEYKILNEWCDFLVSSQDIKVDLFGTSYLFIFDNDCLSCSDVAVMLH